jgi:hypothetical protein
VDAVRVVSIIEPEDVGAGAATDFVTGVRE